ncbi:MAG: FAD-dependent monooxygenase [Mariprofundaceae bacterium]|nr:FAD-dependent monooxygenase [Mariprofundaceae bacterium]
MTQKRSQSALEFDQIIVGAGAVGSALALQFSGLGYRVAVIDARPPSYQSSDPERVIALSYGSRCYLKGLGAWQDDEDIAAGLIRRVHVTEPGNAGLVTMDVTDTKEMAEDVDALGYVVEMGHLLKSLHERMQGQVTLFCPALITNIDSGDAEKKAEVQISHAGKHVVLRGSLLVGADGTNSQVRRRAGIGTKGWDYNRFGLVLSASCKHGHDNVAYECFRESGPLALLPMADGRFSIVWALAPTEAMRLSTMPEPLFMRKLEKAAGSDVIDRTGSIAGIGKRFCFPLELTIAEQYARPRLALVGNAAHTLHPVAGQGMNLGLRDAAVLAEVLSTELAFSDPGAPILMQAYAEKRRLDVMAVSGFTESLTNLFGISLPGARQVRSLALDTMQKMPSVRTLLLRQAAGIGQIESMATHGVIPGKNGKKQAENRVRRGEL